MSERTARPNRRKVSSRRDSINDAMPDVQPPNRITTIKPEKGAKQRDQAEEDETEDNDES